VVWQAAYLPFGQAQIVTGTVTNNLRFPGQYFDAETGLHYNWNRFYDPEVGRYISADPIGLAGGMNLYAYVGGNPVNWIDPFGLERLSLVEITNIVQSNNLSGQSNELIICMIYKESTFDPSAHNKIPGSTATGLMGVTNDATIDLGEDHTAMTNAEKNVRAGSKYLHRRIDWKKPFGSKGDVAEGLAKYGEGEPYAKALLECEKCMKCNQGDPTSECLKPLHGGK